MDSLQAVVGVLEIPKIGFGTYKLTTREELFPALEAAIQAGYRMIDTAQLYKNEALIAEFIYEILPGMGITRQDLWITTKVPFFTMIKGNEAKIREGIEQSIRLFGGHVDLYLIHSYTKYDQLVWRILREYQTAPDESHGLLW